MLAGYLIIQLNPNTTRRQKIPQVGLILVQDYSHLPHTSEISQPPAQLLPTRPGYKSDPHHSLLGLGSFARGSQNAEKHVTF